MMEGKPDFEATRARWARFWAGEPFDRPMMYIRAPRPGFAREPYPAVRHPDEEPPGALAARVCRWLRAWQFLGDAVPFFSPLYSPDHFALLLGADLRAHPDSPGTGWVVPCVMDWDKAPLAPCWDGKWWAHTVTALRALRAQGDGRLLIIPPNLQGGLDCLAALRGSEALLMDMIEAPDTVEAALERVNRAFDAVLARLYEEVDLARWGTATRHGMFCDQPAGVVQCDFSCMIGPDMFARFALPAIAHEAGAFAQAEYHLDGPGAIRHLEAVCGVKRISIIQWQPGAGPGAERDWTDLHRRIDGLGKGQMLHSADHGHLERMWSLLERPNAFFSTFAESSDEAQRLMDRLARIGRAGRERMEREPGEAANS